MGTLKVRCIELDPDALRCNGITYLKAYDVLGEDEDFFTIKDDDGREIDVFKRRFEPVDAASIEIRMGGDLITEKKQKLRYSLIPPEVIELLAQVFDYGAKKHGSDSGWKDLDPQLYEDALMRHLIKIRKGERVDESGFPHWAHVLCNAAMCLWHDLKSNS